MGDEEDEDTCRARAQVFFCTGVLLLRREPRISRSAQVDELAEE